MEVAWKLQLQIQFRILYLISDSYLRESHVNGGQITLNAILNILLSNCLFMYIETWIDTTDFEGLEYI
jgi:hypothetical protein